MGEFACARDMFEDVQITSQSSLFFPLVSSFFSPRLLVSVSSQVTFNVSPPDPDPEPVHVGKAGERLREAVVAPSPGNYNQKVEISPR